ncbi:MAG: CagC family type IV secretion system protein [Tetragenococcus koreensis]|nr:CagC family type IV secretion system protein [Tetragenococcus koreensis]MDN6195150.1 CagC family type IV secretion system protein [Atopostipes suicloacalis]MDN6270083.1 CagC family type IV secretion system protein [Tetragenococcus koreensis]MDN6542056.1 CagC family type IV secretion system protein [Tetragenococcus koreensis]
MQFTAATTIPTLFNAKTAFAASDGGEVEEKVTDAANQVQGILTGLIVIVGICVALFIIIKRLPSADDPREKSEVFKSIGRVISMVALGAAIVWILPWVYNLFT